MNSSHSSLQDLGIAIIAPAGFVLLQDVTAGIMSIIENYRGDGIPSSLISCSLTVILAAWILRANPWISDSLPASSHSKSHKKTEGTSFPCGLIIFILLFTSGISLQMASTGILNLIDACNPDLLNSYRELSQNSFSMDNGFLRVITVMMIAPAAEELVFRGISMHCIQRAFARQSRSHAGLAAVLLSSILFGLYHGNAVQFCYALPAGILLSLLCMWSASLLPGIMLHMVINISSYFTGLVSFPISALPFVILISTVICAVCFMLMHRFFRRQSSHKVS